MISLLDIRTLLLINAIISIGLTFSLIYIYFCRKKYPGFLHWTLATAMSAMGLILIGMRFHWPDALSILLGNSLIFTSIILIPRGLASFCGITQKRPLDIPLLALFIAGYVYFTYADNQATARIIIFYALSAVFWGQTLFMSLRELPKVLPGINWLLSGASGLLLLLSAIHALATLFFEPASTDYFNTGLLQSASLLLWPLFRLVINLSLIILNSQRIEHDLSQASQEIKALQGLLPVCSHCKSVRDDEGEWQTLEDYLDHNTQVQITHGMCPHCMTKLYPDFARG